MKPTTFGPMQIYLQRLDSVYESSNHFVRLKARLLLGINCLLIALVFINLLRFLWVQPPAIPVRIGINLIIAAGIIASIRFIFKGKLELAGSSLALGIALPIHLIIAILPGDFYAEPLGTAFQLFVFDIFLLLLSLIFASKRAAASCFAIIIIGNAQLYFKTLAFGDIAGSLRYSADTLARDGLLALVIIFATGVSLVLLLEVVTKRSQQMLKTVQSTNAKLEERVSERTKELEAVTRKAEAATHAKSEFLANMSHEIRTPLFGIIAQTELLKDQRDRFTEQDLKDLNLISESGDILLRLINDILDFSKIEAQQLKLESSRFTLDRLIQECIATVATGAKKKAHTVTFAASEELKLSLLGDSHRLKQILLNLLSNAIKFTPQGGLIEVEVDVLEIEEARASLRFRVSDNGIGIDAATKENIFNRFTQADSSTTRQYGGTGLGLSISSQLVGMMGGQLTVESEPGAGTCFEFSLAFPLAEKEAVSANPHVALEGPLSLHVLVAEDNNANQLVISKQLESLGCTYRLANNGAEALELLQSDEDIQLVLMDNTMPVMDGQRATRIIREWAELEPADSTKARAAKLPIIMFTANAIDADSFRREYPDMTDVLFKPLRMQQLRTILQKHSNIGPEATKGDFT